MKAAPGHPAKFSDEVLYKIGFLAYFYSTPGGHLRVLDPFAGTGKIKNIFPDAVTLEIEQEWADISGGVIGDAQRLPFCDGSFDLVVTSPVYGNRMSDHHNARDGSRRITYRHMLGRPLHSHNAGRMQWGERYRSLHVNAWREVRRVLDASSGLFILNISDHIRGGAVVEVSRWHLETILSLGFVRVNDFSVRTKRMRFGRNGSARVGHENIFVFRSSEENFHD